MWPLTANKRNLLQFCRMKNTIFALIFFLGGGGYHISEYEKRHYGTLEFTSVFEEAAASMLRAQGPTWRKQVPSKLNVSLHDNTRRCISEPGKVKSNRVLSTGPGWYGVSGHLDTSVLGSQHTYIPGGGISLVVQQTVTLIFLHTELNNEGAYILHFIKDCTRQLYQ